MANGIHAVMHSMQPPSIDSIVSGLPVHPKTFELFKRNEPVLSVRDLSNFAVPPRPTPLPMGRYVVPDSTYRPIGELFGA